MTAKSQYTDSESDYKPAILTYDYQALRKELEQSGWRTPQTYCNFFAEAGDFPAVYTFLLCDRWDYSVARPAYVGMSTRLSQRWCGHEILRELEGCNLYVQRWFLPTEKGELRAVERSYIQKFSPPWNIIGKERGVPLT